MLNMNHGCCSHSFTAVRIINWTRCSPQSFILFYPIHLSVNLLRLNRHMRYASKETLEESKSSSLEGWGTHEKPSLLSSISCRILKRHAP